MINLKYLSNATALIQPTSASSQVPAKTSFGSDIAPFQSNQANGSSQFSSQFFGEDGFTFSDIIDIINPLQHIPIVNTLYRKITGDTIAPAMEVAGGALFGGPIGAVASLVMNLIEHNKNADSENNPLPENNDEMIAATESKNRQVMNDRIAKAFHITNQPGQMTNTSDSTFQVSNSSIKDQPATTQAFGNATEINTVYLDKQIPGNSIDLRVGS